MLLIRPACLSHVLVLLFHSACSSLIQVGGVVIFKLDVFSLSHELSRNRT